MRWEFLGYENFREKGTYLQIPFLQNISSIYLLLVKKRNLIPMEGNLSIKLFLQIFIVNAK